MSDNVESSNEACNLGNAEKARQTITSILHHVSNNHVFPSLTFFPKCAHGPIEVEKEWIQAGLGACTTIYFYEDILSQILRPCRS